MSRCSSQQGRQHTRGKKESARHQGNESDEEKVDKDVMDWVTARRKIQPRTQESRQEEEARKNRQMFQIFGKVDGSKTFALMVSPSDKVDDVIRRILNSVKSSESDVYMT